jgi:methyltransferase (TIGR00027 family)
VDRPPYLFEDTLARRLLGSQADEPLSYHHTAGSHPVLMGTRVVVTPRARYVEDRLAEAVERGMRQYVILGAGLDTFAYRSPMAGQVAVYEVDQPETSAWKLELLEAASIPVPAGVRLVPADLSDGPLVDRLVEAGFDSRQPAFVSWTGVTMYLDRAAVARTLGAIGGLAAGSETVFDHVLPREQRDAAGTEYASFAESVGASNGEPWITSMAIDEVAAILAEAGLKTVAQPLLEDWVDPVLWQRTDSIRPYRLWAMAHSRVAGR